MDAAVRGEEGVGQLARGAVEAVVRRGDQAVRVVDRVEACRSTGLKGGLGAGRGLGARRPPMRRSLGCSGATSRKLKGDTSLHMRKAAARPRRVSLGLSRFLGKERILGWESWSGVAARQHRPPPRARVAPVCEVEVVPVQPGRGQRVAASAGRWGVRRAKAWGGEHTRGRGHSVSLRGKQVPRGEAAGTVPKPRGNRPRRMGGRALQGALALSL